MKVGLIGCGGMGSVHNHALKALAQEMKLEVVALADCRSEFLQRAAEKWPGAKGYDDGYKLIAQAGVDAVHICTPSYLHTEMVVKALEQGLQVFVEKPVCLTEEECITLEQAGQKHNSAVMVGQVVRSFPEFRFLREMYQQGTYGRLKSIVMKRLSGNPVWGFENWFQNPDRSGSVILDLHIHDLDFLRYLLGEPDQVEVSAARFPSGMFRQVVANYTFGEVFANVEGSWEVSEKFPFQASYRAAFERGTVVYNSEQNSGIKIYQEDGEIVIPELLQEYQAEDHSAGINISEIGPYYAEIKYFYECLRQERKIELAPLTEGIASVRLALKEYQLAKQNW